MATTYRVDGQTLVIDLGTARPILSSAVWGGGLVRRRYVLNHQVAANPIRGHTLRKTWPDPVYTLRSVARQLGVGGLCVGLMTAVALRHLVIKRAVVNDMWIEAFLTVGLSNALRAGERPRAHGRPGTINIILVTNARLTPSAMVAAMHVAIEAKTAEVVSAGIRSWTGTPVATGTGTDTTCVVAGNGPALRYSGTHTAFGAHLARLVREGLRVGIRRWRRWHASHD
jgi:adenosylcobinamide hydrolase